MHFWQAVQMQNLLLFKKKKQQKKIPEITISMFMVFVFNCK